MTLRRLILRSLGFYRGDNAGVFAGAALGAAILTGALMVGDSVRYSLVRLTLDRLGRTGCAVSAGERLFTAELAARVGRDLGVAASPLLRLKGFAARPDGRAAANDVQVLGADASLWRLGPGTSPPGGIEPGRVWINARLAGQLDAGVGDTIVLRIEIPGRLPGDAPLSRDADRRTALRLEISRILLAEEFGNLSLRAEQIPPMNAFVSAAELSRAADISNRFNLILVEDAGGLEQSDVAEAISRNWTLSDAGLSIETLKTGERELRSERVFIDDAVVAAAVSGVPAARPVFTYFVNAIDSAGKSTPYSFVSASGEPLVAADMADDEIILNDWVADDIGVGAGDGVTLRYYVMDSLLMSGLREVSRDFRVRSVTPIEGAAADPSLMPMFPGLSDADGCRDWDPGVTIDLSRIRDKDEKYWDKYRGTPKAFVTLEAAREMWSNRFGSHTALRFPPDAGSAADLAVKIMGGLRPQDVGISVGPVRREGIQAGRGGVDFGQLFLGLSFFLIAAALMLTGLLFSFSIERRAEETGLLLALGFGVGRVRWLRLAEGGLLATVGSLFGAVAGVGYNHLLVHCLRTIWRDVVGTAQLYPHLLPSTIVVGWAGGSLAAVTAMWIALRRMSAAPITAVQRADYGKPRPAGRRWSAWLAAAGLGGAAAIALVAGPGRGREAAGAFFAAGAAALIGSVALCRAFIEIAAGSASDRRLKWICLAARSVARRPLRSLTTVGVLGAGVFLVLAVGANRYGASADFRDRASGTGGFAFFAKSALPVQVDPNEMEWDRHGAESTEARPVFSFVRMRLREGDDASCLNLNRVASPPVLGVDPRELDRRGAFTAAALGDNVDPDHPWAVLDRDMPDGSVPAIADQTVIVWGLGKSVGDTLETTDGRGKPLKLKLRAGLANSVLQGHVVISEKAFVRHFPDESGYRVFLVDAPQAGGELAGELTRRMRDWGVEVTPTTRKLASFGAVENMYLAIFQILGGLGLALGSLGLGIVVFRNVDERRRELAMLRAVGFGRSAVKLLIAMEHALLLLAGLACGTVSSLLAVAPALAAPEADVSAAGLIVPVAVMPVIGMAWIVLASVAALRGGLIAALRSE